MTDFFIYLLLDQTQFNVELFHSQIFRATRSILRQGMKM